MSRLAALCQHVLAPLVLGGPLVPQRPFGPRLALEIGAEARIPDAELSSRVDLARVRVARALVAVDTLPSVGPEELTLAAALNDLLVTSHDELEGALSRGRAKVLFDGVRDVLERVPAPRSSREALARHATFARALQATRVDRTVHSWAGREHFRGRVPPGRAVIWRGLRRVRVEETRVALADLCADLGREGLDPYPELLAAWLARSPLTDLATAGRAAPAFRWSTATFSVLVEPTVAQIAERAARAAGKAGAAALLAAAKGLPPDRADVVRRFVDWVGTSAA